MKKTLLVALFVAALLVLLACGGGQPTTGPTTPAGQKMNLLMGGSSAASSYHLYTIAISHMWNTNIPEVNVTPVEVRGSIDGPVMTEDGQLDLYAVGSISSYIGKIMYKIPPHDKRQMKDWWRVVVKVVGFAPQVIYARADSGIKSISDLNGKTVCPGNRGAGSSVALEAMMTALGIKPNYWYGAGSEIPAAVKEGKVVAFQQTGSGYQPNAIVIDVLSGVKLNVISYTEEEKKKVNDSGVVAYNGWMTIPAGVHNGFPGHPAILVPTQVGGCGPATLKDRIPQALGYKIPKVLYEHWKDLNIVWPESKQIMDEWGDPIKFTIALQKDENEQYQAKFQQVFPGASMAPLHPGTVQYFKEKGYDVPKILIPPEYKP